MFKLSIFFASGLCSQTVLGWPLLIIHTSYTAFLMSLELVLLFIMAPWCGQSCIYYLAKMKSYYFSTFGVPARDNQLSNDNPVAMQACYLTKYNNRSWATTLNAVINRLEV